jgi:hypothetical protein
MKKHKKQTHAQKSTTRPRPVSHRKVTGVEEEPVQEQKTDVSWQSEESGKEGADALTVHENGPVSSHVIGKEK